MRPAILILALVPACAAPVPISVRDGSTIGHDMDELPPVVERACAMLEIDCVASSWNYGAVQLDLIETADVHSSHLTVKGRTSDSPCTPYSWADPAKTRYVAHELGHVFELEHVDESGNVMNAHGHGGNDFDDEQLDTVFDAASLFVNCR